MAQNLKHEKSALSRLDLHCMLYLLVQRHPAATFIFKLDEFADLRAKGSLKLKCEYFDADHMYRLVVHEDLWTGKQLLVKPGSEMAKAVAEEIQARKTVTLTPEELVTVLYMMVLQAPERTVLVAEKEFRIVRDSGRIKFECSYIHEEKEFLLLAGQQSKDIILPDRRIKFG